MGMMEQEQEAGQGGYCIEIYVGPDNQVQSVGVEMKPAEGFNAQGTGRDVTDIEQALGMAMEIYQSGGQMDEPGAQPEESPEDAMMRGYNGPSGQRRGMGVNKVFDKGRM